MSDSLFVPSGFRPTDEQLAIQTTRARHVLIEANAGAAKTTTLALRIAQALVRGAQPAMILALTYTEPAVEALRQQLRWVGVAQEQIQSIRIHTFESFSAWLLEAQEGPGALSLQAEEQVRPYVLRAIERAQTLPQERYPDELLIGLAPTALVEGLLQSFAVLKGRMLIEQLPPETPLSPELAEDLGFDYLTLRVRSAYEFIRRGGHPDRPAFRFIGDATYDLARALSAETAELDPACLSLGLALVVLDEMHDTNRAMFTVLKHLLAQNRRAAFVGVGDRDQVIHSQAGAEAAFMHDSFRQELGVPIRLPLTASHRFGPQLAQAAGALAGGKPYAAFHQRQTDICHLACESHRVMARVVAQAAREHLQQEEHAELRVLLRQEAHSILIESELLKCGLSYRVEGFQPFLRRREVLLVRGLEAFCRDDFSGFAGKALRAETLAAMMLFAGALVDSSELRHLDALAAQRRAIDEACLQPDGMRTFIEGQVLRNASSVALPRFRAALALLKSQDLPSFSQAFMKALDPSALAAAVLVRQSDIHQVRDNLAQLVQVIVGEDEGLEAGFRLLQKLYEGQARMSTKPRITLSSIEAAKGLEFDHVLIPHLSRGEFVGEVSAAENRNLLYVAMTRARRRLSLAFDPSKPSRFLREAGLI